MKNIHVLPTNKPSRLSINCETDLLQLGLDNRMFHDDMHIYITSDEEIKEVYWFIHSSHGTTTLLKCKSTNSKEIIDNEDKSCWLEYSHKIILTTDQDLIKDGVQAIPDEFLEWFVRNPSCENIEVVKKRDKWLEFEGKKSFIYKYKIIIPKENELKIGDNTNFGVITDVNEKSVCFGKNKKGIDVWYKKSDVKKITLNPDENVLSLKELLSFYNDIPVSGFRISLHQIIINAYNNGAKWQMERSYSEQEVHNIISNYEAFIGSGMKIPYIEWFEQFKKK